VKLLVKIEQLVYEFPSLFVLGWMLFAHLSAQLYVPFYNPVTDEHVYSWVWQPVNYVDPRMEDFYRTIDRDEIARQLSMDRAAADRFEENSVTKTARYSVRRAATNGWIIFATGIASYGLSRALRKTAKPGRGSS